MSPAFSKDVFSYTATLNDESINEVTVNAKANNSKAKVEITGNKNLVNGENTINIVLTLDGETEQVVYQIVLNKIGNTEEETIETNIEVPTQYTNDSKIKLYILIPILVVILIIVAIVVLIVLIVKENKKQLKKNNTSFKRKQEKI